MSDPKLAEEIARAVGDHGAGTVKLAGYIRDNFALITEHKTHATWAQVAAAIYARGVSDANGGEPSGPTVKEAYNRVARKLAKEAAQSRSNEAGCGGDELISGSSATERMGDSTVSSRTPRARRA